MSLDIEKFDLEKVAFEARFNANWMHFDRAGALWTDANRKFPELRMLETAPQQTTFMLGRAIQLQVLNDRLNVLSAKPMDMEGMHAAANELTRLAIKHFGLTEMSRLGMRFNFFQSKPDIAAANAEFFQLAGLRAPGGKHFGIEGKAQQPQLATRWESATRGAIVRLAAESRKVEFHPNADLAQYIEPVTQTFEGVVIDVDFYTAGQIPISSFKPSDLLDDAHRVIRRDIGGFLTQMQR